MNTINDSITLKIRVIEASIHEYNLFIRKSSDKELNETILKRLDKEYKLLKEYQDKYPEYFI